MTTALYRRYRPESYADVIGQEHVTGPLAQALRTGRVGHAYLFSGPRGCGKTTSARILARCLNCEQGPTPEPCGACTSCLALARGGSGSVDVVEIDAASHGGVDDARDLRERAGFGPAQSRFKVYIIDEAHMVTPQGFNALLKIVEEPPEHVKFVFATTEPEKVIGTIRSRTHHYPFRLVPPGVLTDYLQTVCDAEGVAVEPGVLSFVTRAGGGSVRDSLSVLDQLISGSGDEGLTYAGASSLLGFTDAELLDAVVDAFAAGDAGAVFRQVDRVVESGHDPRRFVEDLLERLRDLIVVAALPEGAEQVLRGRPQDQLDRMRQQAAAFGPQALSRAADLANTGLTEMTGATAPRLQLELIAARILLPGATGEPGYGTRLERIERRLELAGGSGPGRPVEPTRQVEPAETPRQVEPIETPSSVEPTPPVETSRQVEPVETTRQVEPVETPSSVEPTSPVEPAPPVETAPPVEPAGPTPPVGPGRAPAATAPAGERGADAARPAPARPEQTAPGGIDLDAVRRAWPDVLDRIARIKRVTWVLLAQHAQVADFDDGRLVLGISTRGLTDTFRKGPHADVVRRALQEEIGLDARVEAAPYDDPPASGLPATGGTPGPQPGAATSRPQRRTHPPRPPAEQAPPADEPPPDPEPEPTDDPAWGGPVPGPTRPDPWGGGERDGWSAPAAPPPDWAADEGPEPNPGVAEPDPAPGQQVPPAPADTTAADPSDSPRRRAERAARTGAGTGVQEPVADDSAADLDDESVEDAGAVGVPVIESVLGGTVIHEEDERGLR